MISVDDSVAARSAIRFSAAIPGQPAEARRVRYAAERRQRKPKTVPGRAWCLWIAVDRGVIRRRAGLKRTDEGERMTASMDKERASLPSSPATEHEQAGDSACCAHRVCSECGRLNQAEHPDACEACGAAFSRLLGARCRPSKTDAAGVGSESAICRSLHGACQPSEVSLRSSYYL